MSLRNQRGDLGRWLQPQVVPEDIAVLIELPDRLAPVAFGQVGANQDAVCAFPQRLARNGGHPSLHSLPVATRRAELEAKQLESVHAKLAVSLSFDQNPLVVVVGEQLRRRHHGGKIAILHRPAAEQSPATAGDVVEIDPDVRRQAKVLRVCVDEPLPGAGQSPESGAKAAYSVLLGRIGPQGSRDVQPEHRPRADGEKRQETLRRLRDVKGGTVAPQLEAAKQGQLERLAR